MNCPACKSEITKKQLYRLLYGTDGPHKITCVACNTKFIITRKNILLKCDD